MLDYKLVKMMGKEHLIYRSMKDICNLYPFWM